MECFESRRLFKILAHPATVAAVGIFWLAVAALGMSIHQDEGLWGYQGWSWVHYGMPPYTGSVENKTPGIYMLFAFSELLFGHQYWFPRLFGILCVAGTSLLLYQIGKQWRGHWSGLIAMAIYLLANAWRSFAGFSAAFTETFMNLFMTLAYYGILRSSTDEWDRPPRLLIAGFLMGCAIAFKQVAVTSSVALGFFVLYLQKQEKIAPIQPFRTIAWLGMGIILATVVSLTPLWASGVTTRDYIEGAWLILRSSGDTQIWQANYANWATRLIYLPRILKRIDTTAFVVCLIWLWRKRQKLEDQKIPMTGLFIWMIGDALGTYAGGRPGGHQMRQLLPSLSLGLGLLVSECVESLNLKNTWPSQRLPLAGVWLLIVLMIGSPLMPTIQDAWVRIAHPVPTNEQTLGLWLKEHTGEKDFVYVYGSIPHGAASQSGINVLFYSMRRSPSRFFTDYFDYDNAIPELTEDLTIKRPPAFVALQNNEAPDWLWNALAGSYAYRFKRAEFWVYENVKTSMRLQP